MEFKGPFFPPQTPPLSPSPFLLFPSLFFSTYYLPLAGVRCSFSFQEQEKRLSLQGELLFQKSRSPPNEAVPAATPAAQQDQQKAKGLISGQREMGDEGDRGEGGRLTQGGDLVAVANPRDLNVNLSTVTTTAKRNEKKRNET